MICYKMEQYKTNVQRLFRFDLIRASKLLEIVQFGVITFFLAFYIGSWMDSIFPEVSEKTSNADLVRDLILQLALLLIVAYYIKKIAEVIPFLFSLSKEYKPSYKGEAAFGSAIAMVIMFASVQRKFLDKINLFKARFALNKA